jgi:hypothetical protein
LIKESISKKKDEKFLFTAKIVNVWLKLIDQMKIDMFLFAKNVDEKI